VSDYTAILNSPLFTLSPLISAGGFRSCWWKTFRSPRKGGERGEEKRKRKKKERGKKGGKVAPSSSPLST